MAYTQYLNAVDFALGPTREIVVAGDLESAETREMIESVQRMFLPKRVLMHRQEGKEGERLAALAGYTEALRPVDGKATAYVCQNFACQRPITNAQGLRSTLESPS